MYFQLISLLFTFSILALGFCAFGFSTALILACGFVTGFICWLNRPNPITWKRIKWPYYLSIVLFVVHRIEENRTGFFYTLAEITGIPTPEVLSLPVIGLVTLSVAGWIAIPFLLKRKNQFGQYLTWTFFCSLGIVELAHIFIFPILVEDHYAYFPGMVSVFIMAPIAWWGLYRLSSFGPTPSESRLVQDEAKLAQKCLLKGDMKACWRHLERAHIHSQRFWELHIKIHSIMLVLAFYERNSGEFLGQVPRLVLAAPSSIFNFAPEGNPGTTRFGLFEKASSGNKLK